MLSNEGTPLPPAIVGLLKKSLVPRDQRIADVVTWHKTLSKLMIDGQFSPTTFNLAFFMHNLFRDEIERESQEMQAEKKLELTHKPAAPATVPVPVAAPVVDMREKTGVRQTTLAGAQVVSEASSKKGLFIGIAAAALVAVGIGAYFVLGRSSDAPPAIEAPVPAAAATTQQASMPVQPAGPTQEELQAQIQAMLDTRSQEMEAKLKSQYDDRLKQLQQQLEDTRKRESQARVQEQRPAPAPVQTQEPAPATVETKAAAKPPEPVPTPATSTAASVPAPQPSSPAAGTTAEKEKVAASEPEPAPAFQAPAPQPQVPPQIQYGDLVPLGTPGVTAPKLSSRLDPRYPAAAVRMNKSAEVVIKVLVDERGRVVDAQRSGPKAGLGFDEAALDAARRASFNPATTKDGTRVKMWATLRVTFKPN
jgi:TonB family protein